MSYRLYRPDKDDSITTSGSSCSGSGKQSRPIRMTSSPHHTHINSTGSDMRNSTGAGAGAGAGMSSNCSISGAGSSSSSSSRSLGTIFGGATSSFEFPELYPMGRSAATSNRNNNNSSSSGGGGGGSATPLLYIGVEFLTSTALRYVLM